MTESWSFLTNHLEVLVAVERDRNIRLRDLAVQVGVTERTVQGIVADLTRAGYLTVARIGRRNRYEVHAAVPFCDRAQQERPVSRLLSAFTAE